jgi:hypothetical protein
MGEAAYTESMKCCNCRVLALFAGLLLPTVEVLAGPIYHWVDEDGVHHYTETAPPSRSTDVELVTVEDTRSPDYDPEQDLYNVAGQAERMQARRDELAQKREAARERQERLAQQQPTVVYRDAGLPYSSTWWGGNPGYPVRPGKPPVKPGRPPWKPGKPELPIEPPEPVNPPSYPFRPLGRDR